MMNKKDLEIMMDINSTDEVTDFFKKQVEKSKREKNLESHFKLAKMDMALKALYKVKNDMSKEKGFKRHDNSDYYTHLYDVTLYLWDSGYNTLEYQDLLVASLLHDYVEDVEGVTLKFVEELFNKNVATIVGLVTKKAGVDYKVDLEEKKRYLGDILLQRFAILIKVADRVCNFTTMRNSSQKHRLAQLNETKKYFIPLIKVARETHKLDESFYYQALVVLRPMISEVERSLKADAENEKLKAENEKLKQALKKLEGK